MNREFVQAYPFKSGQTKLCSQEYFGEALELLCDSAVEHDEANQKLRRIR